MTCTKIGRSDTKLELFGSLWDCFNPFPLELPNNSLTLYFLYRQVLCSLIKHRAFAPSPIRMPPDSNKFGDSRWSYCTFLSLEHAWEGGGKCLMHWLCVFLCASDWPEYTPVCPVVSWATLESAYPDYPNVDSLEVRPSDRCSPASACNGCDDLAYPLLYISFENTWEC